MSKGRQRYAIPVTKAEADYEARLRGIDDWLVGRDGLHPWNGPDRDPKSKPVEVTVEVGERREPDTSGQPRNAPGTNVIGAEREDDAITRHGGWTVMDPAKLRRDR